MSQDSSDTPAAGLGSPLMTRWDPAQLARAQAVADATGLPRAVVIRAAFDHGIAIVERSVSAVQGTTVAPVREVGAVSGTGEPA